MSRHLKAHTASPLFTTVGFHKHICSWSDSSVNQLRWEFLPSRDCSHQKGTLTVDKVSGPRGDRTLVPITVSSGVYMLRLPSFPVCRATRIISRMTHCWGLAVLRQLAASTSQRDWMLADTHFGSRQAARPYLPIRVRPATRLGGGQGFFAVEGREDRVGFSHRGSQFKRVVVWIFVGYFARRTTILGMKSETTMIGRIQFRPKM